jgi:hypothetical protein
MEPKEPIKLAEAETSLLSAVNQQITAAKAHAYDVLQALEQAQKQVAIMQTQTQSVLTGIARSHDFTGQVRVSDDLTTLTEA